MLGAAAIALTGKIVWDWLNKKRNGNGIKRPNTTCYQMMRKMVETIEEDVDEIKSDTEWTREIHAQTDEAGRPKWYFPPEIIGKIEGIDTNTKEILTVIKQLLEENKAMNAALLEAIRSR